MTRRTGRGSRSCQPSGRACPWTASWVTTHPYPSQEVRTAAAAGESWFVAPRGAVTSCHAGGPVAEPDRPEAVCSTAAGGSAAPAAGARAGGVVLMDNGTLSPAEPASRCEWASPAPTWRFFVPGHRSVSGGSEWPFAHSVTTSLPSLRSWSSRNAQPVAEWRPNDRCDPFPRGQSSSRRCPPAPSPPVARPRRRRNPSM